MQKQKGQTGWWSVKIHARKAGGVTREAARELSFASWALEFTEL